MYIYIYILCTSLNRLVFTLARGFGTRLDRAVLKCVIIIVVDMIVRVIR